MFKKCLEQLDISDDLAQITWANEFADFNSFPMQIHLGKISAYLNEMSGVTMKLGLDENGELKVMPDFHSILTLPDSPCRNMYLSLQIIRLPMQTGLVLPPVSAVVACLSRTETVRNIVIIRNVKRNETAENPAQLITGKYRKKMITAGRNHYIFTLGQDVASNIGYFLYRLYKNNLYYLPQAAPTFFIEKRHRFSPTPQCDFILILHNKMLNFQSDF